MKAMMLICLNFSGHRGSQPRRHTERHVGVMMIGNYQTGPSGARSVGNFIFLVLCFCSAAAAEVWFGQIMALILNLEK